MAEKKYIKGVDKVHYDEIMKIIQELKDKTSELPEVNVIVLRLEAILDFYFYVKTVPDQK